MPSLEARTLRAVVLGVVEGLAYYAAYVVAARAATGTISVGVSPVEALTAATIAAIFIASRLVKPGLLAPLLRGIGRLLALTLFLSAIGYGRISIEAPGVLGYVDVTPLAEAVVAATLAYTAIDIAAYPLDASEAWGEA